MSVDLLETGRLLGGRYRIVGRIGAGGMGVVFSAYDELTADVVAIKTMLGPLAERPDVIARFRREARIASRIEHPAVVRTLDVGETEDGAPYLVMELLEGMSLASILDDGVKLPLALSVAIVRHAISGVVAAHEAGVIHRDLKPDNLFLHRAPDRDGAPRATVKLVDFGVGKATDVGETMLTRTGGVIGTPFYMAPEQASGEAIDPRVDIYAIGAVTYELVCGERAFGDKVGAALMVDIMKGARRRVQSLAPETPESLVAWIDRAMAPRREDRFATAMAAMEALQESVRAVSTGALATDDDAFSASLGKLIAPGRRAPEVAMQSTLPGRSLRAAERTPSDADTAPDATTRTAPTPKGRAPALATPAPSTWAIGPLQALVLGVIASVSLGVVLVQLERLPSTHAGGDGAASEVLGAVLVGLSWLFVAAMSVWMRRDAQAKPLLRIALAEATYNAFLITRELSPSLADHPIVSILGHGSNMVALSGGLWLAARVMRLEGPRIERAIRINEAASLGIALFTGTRWWSFRDASGLHAGPLMYAMTPFGVGTGIVLGAIIVGRAPLVADVDRRRRQRAVGLGFIVYGLAKGTHAARYMGASTQAFSLAGLISPALLAYGALQIDAVIATGPRGRESALRLVQSAVLALLALYVAAFFVVLARDWSPSSSLVATLFAAVSAVAQLGLAASVLRTESPS
ncbi:MAG: serine/threonine-protein kinase, partial [Polyangiales bacterium]